MDEIPPAVGEYTNQSLSAIHHALRASRRRLIIGLVAHRFMRSTKPDWSVGETEGSETSPVVSVRQLSREIVAIEDDVSLDQATGDSYHSVYTSLIQTHLPELERVGAISYDPDRKTVAPESNLVALSMVAALSSPTARLLFHSAIADLHSGGAADLHTSISD